MGCASSKTIKNDDIDFDTLSNKRFEKRKSHYWIHHPKTISPKNIINEPSEHNVNKVIQELGI